MTVSDYHIPVMLSESIDALDLNEESIVVDLTFGGGGHSNEIVKRLGFNGMLYAFDQDLDAKNQLIDHQNLTFSLSNFRHFGRWLEYYERPKVDAVFADLGVSSWQIDEEQRGFAFRFNEGLLDMRMNPSAGFTASDVVMRYSQSDLVSVFSEYGEVRNSKALASAVVDARGKWNKEVSIPLFNALLDKKYIGDRNRYFSQVYQALRIEVNDEMGALRDMLVQVEKYLKPGGVFAVLTYHSLEDKLVKNVMRSGNISGKDDKDDYGNSLNPYKRKGPKYLEPTEEEVVRNNRARSAKLRVVERR
jgi:16S rRNA (cytosine1402-N4)-methyltransferase